MTDLPAPPDTVYEQPNEPVIVKGVLFLTERRG